MREIRARISQRHGIELTTSRFRSLPRGGSRRSSTRVRSSRRCSSSSDEPPADARRRTAGHGELQLRGLTLYDSTEDRSSSFVGCSIRCSSCSSTPAGRRAHHASQAQSGGRESRRRTRSAADRVERAPLRDPSASRPRDPRERASRHSSCRCASKPCREGRVRRTASPDHREHAGAARASAESRTAGADSRDRGNDRRRRAAAAAAPQQADGAGRRRAPPTTAARPRPAEPGAGAPAEGGANANAATSEPMTSKKATSTVTKVSRKRPRLRSR